MQFFATWSAAARTTRSTSATSATAWAAFLQAPQPDRARRYWLNMKFASSSPGPVPHFHEGAGKDFRKQWEDLKKAHDEMFSKSRPARRDEDLRSGRGVRGARGARLPRVLRAARRRAARLRGGPLPPAGPPRGRRHARHEDARSRHGRGPRGSLDLLAPPSRSPRRRDRPSSPRPPGAARGRRRTALAAWGVLGGEREARETTCRARSSARGRKSSRGPASSSSAPGTKGTARAATARS